MSKSCPIANVIEQYTYERLPAPTTISNIKLVQKLLLQDMGIDSLDSLSNDTVYAWRNIVLQRVQPQSWNTYFRHLRVLVNFAKKRCLLARDPLKGMSEIKSAKERPKIIHENTLEQVYERLQEGIDNLPPAWFWLCVVRFTYFTGMRRRQIVELRWEDLDVNAMTIRLRAESSKTKREWFIPLLPELLQDLISLSERTANRTGSISPSAQVFNVTIFNDRYRGDELTCEQLSGFYRRLTDKLGTKISSHRLRHTMATELVEQGHLAIAKDILGHTDIRTTMKYVHPNIESMRNALSVLRRM